MKTAIVLLISLFPVISFSQSRSDSIRLIRGSLQLSDLDFTDAEIDSMLDGVKDNAKLYRDMHRFYPPNDLPYPFAFNPKLPVVQKEKEQGRINWKVPGNVALPVNRNDLAFFSIPELASLVKNKKISSTELTRFFLERLKKWGDTLECVITLTEELAMQQAAKADEEIKKGIYKGPLHGIPYGLKDLFAVKGYKTTWGTTPYKNQEIPVNAYVYEQLKKAGAVLCAKLSLGSLAYNNKWFGGETKNPWNLSQGSSGSSAGSAAATSAGLLPFAIGSETWGSIISPSTRCGVTGLRPSFGTVSRTGAMVLCWSLDKIGPICRNAGDAAIVYSYIHGTDGLDPNAGNHSFSFPEKTDPRKMRIAYAENYFRRLDSNSAERKVLEVFREMGNPLIPVNFPDSSIYPFDMMDIILSSESAAAFDELTRTNRDDQIERQDKNFWPNIFRTARTIPAVEYINANRYRSTLCRELEAFMQQYDVVIVPSFAGRQLAITNLTGHPAVCVPIGFNRNGTPLSITFLGKLYGESSILAAAKAFQDRTDHHLKHPAKFK